MSEGTIERHGAKARLLTTASAAIEDAYRKNPDGGMEQGAAILDDFALFGFEIEEMPDNDRWLRKLKLMERRGHIDLSSFDLEDDVDVEFLFVRYVFMTSQDVIALGKGMGANKNDLKSALEQVSILE